METLKELYKKYREQIVYIFFGGMTTAVNLGIYYLFAYFLLPENVDKSYSKAIAWVVAVIFAFFVNKFFVFKHQTNEHIIREFLTFFGARALSGIIEVGGIAIFVDMLHFNDFIVNFAIAVFGVAFNYVLSKFLIFRK